MTEENGHQTQGNGFDTEAPGHPAREMSLHLLRMLETRMDAAGIAFKSETQLLTTRLQLRLLAAAAIFISIWGGIVLLAIALPPNLRVPVLSAVVLGFVLAGVCCQLAANRKASSGDVGSMSWFLDGLKLDLEVLSRALDRSQSTRSGPDAPSEETRSTPSDLAA
jgi:uncharacterized membrane protein YqjE